MVAAAGEVGLLPILHRPAVYNAVAASEVAGALRAAVRRMLPRKGAERPAAETAPQLSNLHLLRGQQRLPPGAGPDAVLAVQLWGVDGAALDVLSSNGLWLCPAAARPGRPSAQAALRCTAWGDAFVRHVAPALGAR